MSYREWIRMKKGEPQMNPPPPCYGATGKDERRYGGIILRSEISKFIRVHLR
jgi:hypothetical protein